MRTFQLIEEFLESTTVHGFAYIHSTHPRISRFLWVNDKVNFNCRVNEDIHIYISVGDSTCRIDALRLSDFSGIPRMG